MYLETEFDRASREYHEEVEAVAARLVREGHHPADAMRRAEAIVMQRRQRKAKYRIL